MKVFFSIEGDFHEEFDTIKDFVSASDYSSAVWEARQEIRARLKYGENISDEEEKLLFRIQDILDVPYQY